MKYTKLILAASAMLTASSNAALTLAFTNLNADSSTGSSDSGTFSATTSPSSPAGAVTATGVQAANSLTYSYSVTGLTIDGQAGYNLTFDMNVTAGAGQGVTQEEIWMVEGGDDGGNPDVFRITTGETLTFSIANAVVSGGPTAATAAFTGFDSINFDLSGANTVDLAAGTFTGNEPVSGANGNRVSNVGFTMELTAVPEPSSAALLGLGGLAMILRRRK